MQNASVSEALFLEIGLAIFVHRLDTVAQLNSLFLSR